MDLLADGFVAGASITFNIDDIWSKEDKKKKHKKKRKKVAKKLRICGARAAPRRLLDRRRQAREAQSFLFTTCGARGATVRHARCWVDNEKSARQ